MRDDGGPAFPVEDANKFLMAYPQGIPKEMCGMTLRDYFAGKAMQGFIANSQRAKNLEETRVPGERAITATAEHAYQVADAMLAERRRV